MLNARENNAPLDYIIRILFFTYTFCMTMHLRFPQMEENANFVITHGVLLRARHFFLKEITGYIAPRKRRYEDIMAHKKQLPALTT